MNETGSPAESQPQRLFSATLIRVGTQVGCLTFIIIFASLLAGLLLDRAFDTKPLFTILFLVGSMPFSWITVFWIVNRAKKELQPPVMGKPSSYLEEENSDRE